MAELATLANLKDLPASWLVAFAARCVRRVQPLLSVPRSVDDDESGWDIIINFVEQAAEASQVAASTDAFDTALQVIQTKVMNCDFTSPAQEGVFQAWLAASDFIHWTRLINASACQLRTVPGEFVTDHVRLAAQKAVDAAKRGRPISEQLNVGMKKRLSRNQAKTGTIGGGSRAALKVKSAIYRDVEFLRNWSSFDKERMTSAAFGPLWPNGTPEGWEETGSVIPIQSCSAPIASPTSSLSLLSTLDADYQLHRSQIRRRIQQILAALAHTRFPSLENKKEIVARIREHLRSANLRILCPLCHKPANLKAAAAGTSKEGVFQFDHPTPSARSTHGGQASFPADLKLESISESEA